MGGCVEGLVPYLYRKLDFCSRNPPRADLKYIMQTYANDGKENMRLFAV